MVVIKFAAVGNFDTVHIVCPNFLLATQPTFKLLDLCEFKIQTLGKIWQFVSVKMQEEENMCCIRLRSGLVVPVSHLLGAGITALGSSQPQFHVHCLRCWHQTFALQ